MAELSAYPGCSRYSFVPAGIVASIAQSPGSLCACCRMVDVPGFFLNDPHDAEHPHQRESFALDTLNNILARSSSCDLCALVVAALYIRAPDLVAGTGRSLDMPTVSLRSVPTGSYDVNESDSQVVRHISVGANCGSTSPYSGHVSGDFGGVIRLLANDAHLLGQQPLLNGRLIGNHVSPSLLWSWIMTCNHCHERCREIRSRWDCERLTGPRSLIVIDPIEMRLVKHNMFTFHDYIALSYVWGDHRGLQLTRATRSQLFQKGALQKAWDALPAVIQDAIELVRELDHFHQQEPYDAKKSKEPEGRRLFLWVDQLCIVQDDEFGKALQIEQMGHIYSNAVATIMALEGEHSDMVLIRAKPDGKPRNIFPDSPTLPTNIGPLAQEEQVVRNVQGLRLVAALPAITSSVESCKWSTRAWTMQEKELSHRAIMFTNHQVYFQCREEIFQEDIVAERSFTAHDTSQSTKSSWSVPPELIRAQQPSDSAQWPQTWHMYCDIVASYMLREMTFATDILAAFRGVASVMHCIADWDQPNGIPIDILDYALLWRPIGAIRRRFPCSLDTQTTASEKTLQLPSYAWAAWVGPIDYEANTALTSLVPRFERVLNNGKTTKLVHIPRYDQKKEWQQTLEPGEDETPADASNLQNFGKLFTTGPPQVRSLAFRMHLINKPSSMWDQDGPFVLQFRAKCLRLRLGGKAKDNTHLRTPKVLLLDNDNARVGFVWHVPLLDADRSIDRHVDVVLLSKFDKIDASERDFIHELSDPPLIELEPCGFINVMLVMRMPGSDMVERLTIGKIRETYAKSAREETIRLT